MCTMLHSKIHPLKNSPKNVFLFALSLTIPNKKKVFASINKDCPVGREKSGNKRKQKSPFDIKP